MANWLTYSTMGKPTQNLILTQFYFEQMVGLENIFVKKNVG